MLNNVVLIGRIKEFNKERESIKIQIQDKEDKEIIIEILLNNQMFNNTITYCSIDCLVGIKGRLTTNDNEQLKIEVEKISFLQTNQ